MLRCFMCAKSNNFQHKYQSTQIHSHWEKQKKLMVTRYAS